MSKGFTLIEVLIAMSILSGIVFIVSMFGLDIFSFQVFLGDVFTMQQDISLTLTSMGLEIRATGPSANGSYPIESASSDSLTFYSDIDGDSAFERVRYFVSGTTLKRGIIEPSGNPAVYNLANEISTDVVKNIILPPSASQPLFSYYDQNYTGDQVSLSLPIDVNKIRLIRATVTADKTPQDLVGRIDYSSTMLIRNLRNVQ
ncbi:MAG: prepilin-type N-terminal cleavage/methylation domain-containing protein [bacterium]|nr:prepilin-type N-terminal cleavage/methylation domain-containing protein [bacterium]